MNNLTRALEKAVDPFGERVSVVQHPPEHLEEAIRRGLIKAILDVGGLPGLPKGKTVSADIQKMVDIIIAEIRA